MPDANDRAEIVQATYLYARGLDRQDPKEAISAYTDDAVWDASAVGLQRFEGRAEVLAFFERDAASMAEQFHIMTNHVVEFDDADHAHGTNYVFSEGRTTSGASIKAIALNVDTYRRTADGWKIASRVISPLTTPQMEGFEA
ncbi:nuclear transport factor 2 family protein [Actinomycetospora termitidis]|uniref:Nuclear transport factor 2 family protein n=1 Tax=Actinomycetospora termitidis TaxID=3053470 RepID=A0ABT7MBM7_9PSEU|nr:nuclear transport factor 2 family protein [Actinomycetospora sp. Odt1-22]MDL5157407.1 nuclear transport factor 2 family protein [Actinomycetospora sp. Odt1-22]